MSSSDLSQRILESTEIFTQKELWQAAELIAPQLGWVRPGFGALPEKAIAQTVAMSLTTEDELNPDGTVKVPGRNYDHIGILLVRERTMHDLSLKIPMLIDSLLEGNMTPSQFTYATISRIALAKTVIVSPPNLVEKILDSTDNRNTRFFYDFDVEYGKWLQAIAEEASKKKDGPVTGSESSL